MIFFKIKPFQNKVENKQKRKHKAEWVTQSSLMVRFSSWTPREKPPPSHKTPTSMRCSGHSRLWRASHTMGGTRSLPSWGLCPGCIQVTTCTKWQTVLMLGRKQSGNHMTRCCAWARPRRGCQLWRGRSGRWGEAQPWGSLGRAFQAAGWTMGVRWSRGGGQCDMGRKPQPTHPGQWAGWGLGATGTIF